MMLTQDQQLAIVRALENKIGDRPIECPVCGRAGWTVQSKLALIPATNDPNDSSSFGRSVYPAAVLFCDNCGNIILLGLFKLGLAEEFGLNTDELAANASE